MRRAAVCLLAVAFAWPGNDGLADESAPRAEKPAGESVKVLAVDGETRHPCPDIAAPSSAGRRGCVLNATSGGVTFAVLTAVGEFRFGRCEMYFTTRVDGSGKTLTEDVGVLGESPCPDVKPCFPGHFRDRRDRPPWSGRIWARAGGAFEHVVDACFDTCLGRFEGRLRIELQNRGGIWRARTDVGAVGTSGWRVADGAWDLGSNYPSDPSRSEIDIQAR